jgi:hypothetical protein
MKTRLLLGLVGAGFVFAPIFAAETPRKESGMTQDMREAIAFQRAKDRADARQERLEAKHPTVTYTDANRSADRSVDPSEGRPVKDPGPAPTSKKDQ